MVSTSTSDRAAAGIDATVCACEFRTHSTSKATWRPARATAARSLLEQAREKDALVLRLARDSQHNRKRTGRSSRAEERWTGWIVRR